MIINGQNYKRMRGTVFTHKEFRGVKPDFYRRYIGEYPHRRAMPLQNGKGRQLWGKYFMIYVCDMNRFLEPHICLN